MAAVAGICDHCSDGGVYCVVWSEKEIENLKFKVKNYNFKFKIMKPWKPSFDSLFV